MPPARTTVSRPPPDREKVWGDIVARRLLADYTTGKRRSLEGVAIEEACDLAMRKIIGRVDRGKLVAHTSRRVDQLLDHARIVVRARS